VYRLKASGYDCSVKDKWRGGKEEKIMSCANSPPKRGTTMLDSWTLCLATSAFGLPFASHLYVWPLTRNQTCLHCTRFDSLLFFLPSPKLGLPWMELVLIAPNPFVISAYSWNQAIPACFAKDMWIWRPLQTIAVGSTKIQWVTYTLGTCSIGSKYPYGQHRMKTNPSWLVLVCH
jgi:hypothetical protein